MPNAPLMINTIKRNKQRGSENNNTLCRASDAKYKQFPVAEHFGCYLIFPWCFLICIGFFCARASVYRAPCCHYSPDRYTSACNSKASDINSRLSRVIRQRKQKQASRAPPKKRRIAFPSTIFSACNIRHIVCKLIVLDSIISVEHSVSITFRLRVCNTEPCLYYANKGKIQRHSHSFCHSIELDRSISNR